MKHVMYVSRVNQGPAAATSLLVKQEQVALLGEVAAVLAAFLEVFTGVNEAQP